MQGLKGSVDGLMKLNPFQGIIDHSMLTNKLLGTMNTNMSNLLSEIRNVSNSSPTKQLNKDLEETQTPIDNIQQGLDSIRRSLISVGDIDTAQKVKEYEYELLNAKEVNSTLNQQISATKNLIAETYNTEEVERFKNALNFEDKTYVLTERLKEVEQQLRACGETAKANKVKEYMQETQKKTIDVDSSINELRADIEKCFGTDAVNDFNNKLNETNSKVKNVSKNSNFRKSLKTALGIGTVALGIRKGFNFLQSSTNESIDFVEQQNLFNVSMGRTIDQYGNLDREASKYYTKAVAFQNKLSEKLGINIAESMQYQALFNAMSKSMGISAKYAYTLSENFTKLGYDLASLYNIDPENAMQKLRAGLSGQTKPLRDLGLDITSQSLEPLLDELGIERSVKQLSQAEKMVARYIVVLRQASIAHGDFAKTMDSPANQLRIFNAQLTAFKRNMGNLWQGMLGGILPYINAIMMVINELLKMIAKLFGFKVSEQNANISASIGADDLASDLGTATGKAKELKKQLMGFDEINNITLPDKTSGGSGGGASVGGIDQRLLDAMKEYDNLMSKVKNKATDIRDKIMEWLGFTKKINPLTGEVSWELGKGNTNLKKILNTVKLLAGLYIGVKVLKLIGYLRTLKSVFLGTKAPMTSFQNGLALIGTGFKGTIKWVKDGIKSFKSYYNETGKVTTSLGKTSKSMFNAIPNAVKLTAGITGLTISMYGAYDSMRDYAEGTKSANKAFSELGITIAGASASGALLGSVIPGIGTGLGALAGALIGATTGVIGYNSAMDETQIKLKQTREQWAEQNEIVKKSSEEWNGMVNAVQETLNSNLAEIENTQRLTNELENLVDSNGKVKKGYEARVEYILNNLNNALGTEYKLVDNQITKNGEIINSYKDIKNEVYNLIEAKKAQAVYEANASMYAESLKKQQGYYNQLEDSQNRYNKSLENMQGFLNYYKDENNYKWIAEQLNDCNVTVEDIINNTEKWQGALGLIRVDSIGMAQQLGKEAEEHRKAIKQNEEAYNSASRTYKQANDFIIAQDNLGTAILTGNKEEINKALESLTSTYETETGTQTATFSQRINNQIAFSNQLKESLKQNNLEITEDTQNQLNAGLKAVADNLREQSNTVENLTPDIVGAWKILGEEQYDIYEEQLNKIDPAIRTEIQNMTGVIVEKTPEVERVTQELSNTIVGSLDNSQKTRQKAVEAVKEYMNGLSEPQQRELLRQCGIENADKVIEGLKRGDLSEDVGINIIKGLRTGLQNNYWQGRTLSTAFSFATDVLNKFKRTFGIQSPSKKTRRFGMYLLEGLGIGIEKEENSVLKTVGNFSNKVLDKFGIATNGISQGISINPNDFKIDTNQFIDYGQISGAIATQSNVKVDSNIEGRIENAIYRGLSNATIPVEIEATTDEGIIFKKVQVKAREFAMQTGEPAFDF